MKELGGGGFGKRRLCVCTFRGLCLCLRGLARPECAPHPPTTWALFVFYLCGFFLPLSPPFAQSS